MTQDDINNFRKEISVCGCSAEVRYEMCLLVKEVAQKYRSMSDWEGFLEGCGLPRNARMAMFRPQAKPSQEEPKAIDLAGKKYEIKDHNGNWLLVDIGIPFENGCLGWSFVKNHKEVSCGLEQPGSW